MQAASRLPLHASLLRQHTAPPAMRRQIRLLVAEVRDTGNGIPPALHEQFFAEFAQINVTTPKPPGLGLGLSISRRLARLMGGDLTVAGGGAPGEGRTCFRLTTPVTGVADLAGTVNITPAPDTDAPLQPILTARTPLSMLVAEV